MHIFVLLGALTGVLGFCPLILSLKASKKVTSTSNLGYGALLILGVFASLIILIAAVAACFALAKESLVEFALSAAITLVVIAIIYGVYTVIGRNKAAKARAKKGSKSKGK